VQQSEFFVHSTPTGQQAILSALFFAIERAGEDIALLGE
jgi:hypothetical protein